MPKARPAAYKDEKNRERFYYHVTDKNQWSSGGGLAVEALGGVERIGGGRQHRGDGGGGRPDGKAPGDHLVDPGGFAGEEGLHGAVAAVADPAGEPERAGRLHRPVAEEDALHAALHHDPHRLGGRLLREAAGAVARGEGGGGRRGEAVAVVEGNILEE
uniref:Uncharacterized protein n=1 Tax=Aegilops tauschii TaxID=37682 RepID=N1QP47_AEGTA